jgi:hypothetical protein
MPLLASRETLERDARFTPSCSVAHGLHDPAERGDLANAVSDRVANSDTDSDAGKLTDSVARAHRAPVVRPAQRAIWNGRVGTGRGNATLPII